MNRKILIGGLIAIITGMMVFFFSTVFFQWDKDISPVYNSGQDSSPIPYYESEEGLLSLDCGMSIELSMPQACDNKEYEDVYICWLESGTVEYIGRLGSNNFVSYRASVSGQCMLICLKEDGSLENITKQLDIAYADIDFGKQ
ncbi:MAG: hypothetical protein K2G89_01420 [Lachnospiraceae bacterium]|nr:hypothetical protein [Lachnospiraceae bacterium]